LGRVFTDYLFCPQSVNSVAHGPYLFLDLISHSSPIRTHARRALWALAGHRTMGRSLPADEPAANGDSGGRWQSHKDIVYFIPLTECRLDHLPSVLCGQIEDYHSKCSGCATLPRVQCLPDPSNNSAINDSRPASAYTLTLSNSKNLS
jgi:hypothetical protein